MVATGVKQQVASKHHSFATMLLLSTSSPLLLLCRWRLELIMGNHLEPGPQSPPSRPPNLHPWEGAILLPLQWGQQHHHSSLGAVGVSFMRLSEIPGCYCPPSVGIQRFFYPHLCKVKMLRMSCRTQMWRGVAVWCRTPCSANGWGSKTIRLIFGTVADSQCWT